jgi:hypothetical protein
MKRRKKENEFYNAAMEEEIARCDEANDVYGNQRETFKNIIDMTKRISNLQQTLRTTINDIEDHELKREVKLYLSIMQKETRETRIRPDIMDNAFKPSLHSELKIEN